MYAVNRLWIAGEWNVDRHNKKDQQLYQVMAKIKTDNGIRTITGTAGLLGKALAEEMPEVP